MPIDLLGKAHKTIIIEGVNNLEHEDCANYVISICGPAEVYESVDGKDDVSRLWIIFQNQISVETACSRLEGTTFQFAENVMSIRRADEKQASGKSILSTYSTAATLAPRTDPDALSGGGAGGGAGGPKIAGLLGGPKGSSSAAASTTATAVRNAAAQRANNNAMMVALLSSKSGGDSMQLLLGGPQGWKVGDKNENQPLPTAAAAQKKQQRGGFDDENDHFLREAEEQLQKDIVNNATIKTTTANLLQTDAELAAEKAIAATASKTTFVAPSGLKIVVGGSSGGGILLSELNMTESERQQKALFTLGNKTIPSNMLLSDVDHFMSEQLRRQVDALLLLGEEQEEALMAEIKALEEELVEVAAAKEKTENVAGDANDDNAADVAVLSDSDAPIVLAPPTSVPAASSEDSAPIILAPPPAHDAVILL